MELLIWLGLNIPSCYLFFMPHLSFTLFFFDSVVFLFHLIWTWLISYIFVCGGGGAGQENCLTVYHIHPYLITDYHQMVLYHFTYNVWILEEILPIPPSYPLCYHCCIFYFYIGHKPHNILLLFLPQLLLNKFNKRKKSFLFTYKYIISRALHHFVYIYVSILYNFISTGGTLLFLQVQVYWW